MCAHACLAVIAGIRVKLMLCWAQVLVRLHADVLPHVVDPLLLTDFLTHALDGGGLNGALLALFSGVALCA